MHLEFSTSSWSKENVQNKIKLRKLIKSSVNRIAKRFRINKCINKQRLIMSLKLISEELNYY